MSELVLLVVGGLSLKTPTVVGSDVLPRREKVIWGLKQSALRPQSYGGKKQGLSLFTLTRDHSQTLEKSGRCSVFSVVTRRADSVYHCVLPLSIGVD